MTALNYYKAIIDYMVSKDIKPIVILGTGYPEWVLSYISQYTTCQQGVTSYPTISELSNINNNSKYIKGKNNLARREDILRILGLRINESEVKQLVNNIIKKSIKYFNRNTEIELIGHIKRECPYYYEVSAKGYLTQNDIENIVKLCPSLPLKINKGYIKDHTVYVKPLPQTLSLLQQDTNILSVICEEYMEPVIEGAYWYAFMVSYYLGNKVTYYQLGNELNHFVDPMPSEYDTAYIESLANGVDMGESYRDSNYLTIINVFADITGWENTLRDWLTLSSEEIDIIAIDHYPGTWTLTYFNDWSPLDSLIQMAQEYNKMPAIMETGYPSSGYGHTEEGQKYYIDVAFDAIVQKTQNNYIAFLSWYMLWDESPISCELGYCGWGVLRENFTIKPAWYTLKNWFTDRLG